MSDGEIVLAEARAWLRKDASCSVGRAAGGFCASLASIELQDWLSLRLCAMLRLGVRGFNWDYTFWMDSSATEYAQVRGWLRVLATLRACAPGLVMDHRQQAHSMGPWYQLAGSYDEPLRGDENPETIGVSNPPRPHTHARRPGFFHLFPRNDALFAKSRERVSALCFRLTRAFRQRRLVPNLHNSRVFADYHRLTAAVYRVGQLLPSARKDARVGFIFRESAPTWSRHLYA